MDITDIMKNKYKETIAEFVKQADVYREMEIDFSARILSTILKMYPQFRKIDNGFLPDIKFFYSFGYCLDFYIHTDNTQKQYLIPVSSIIKAKNDISFEELIEKTNELTKRADNGIE